MPENAHAFHSYLQVSTSSSLGTPCFSGANDADIKLLKCHNPDYIATDLGFDSIPDCPYDLFEMPITTCKVGHDDEFVYICTWSDGPEYACDNCGLFYTETPDGAWEEDGVIYEDTYILEPFYSDDYMCEVSEYLDTRYACYENQYLTFDGYMPVCNACPSTGVVAGSSPYGTTDITGCYAAAGDAFKDSTGSGTFMNDCYYTQGQ